MVHGGFCRLWTLATSLHFTCQRQLWQPHGRASGPWPFLVPGQAPHLVVGDHEDAHVGTLRLEAVDRSAHVAQRVNVQACGGGRSGRARWVVEGGSLCRQRQLLLQRCHQRDSSNIPKASAWLAAAPTRANVVQGWPSCTPSTPTSLNNK